jgi:hypothetical protein
VISINFCPFRRAGNRRPHRARERQRNQRYYFYVPIFRIYRTLILVVVAQEGIVSVDCGDLEALMLAKDYDLNNPE